MMAAIPDRVRILIVDDHDENLLALEAVLTDPSYELVRANSGRAALREVLRSDFAVVLLDVAMPDMDGYETAALIRDRQRSRETPIIFLTANYRSERHVFRGYSVGAVDYLFKPFSPDVLKSKVSVFVELFQKREALLRQTIALQRAHDELEARVEERTADLAAVNSSLRREVAIRERTEQQRQQLLIVERDLRTQAEQANRLKDEFLATLSHELRTPLNAILGWTHLLALPTSDPDMAARAVTVIKNNAVAQSQIIEDILDVSRIIGGKLRLRLAPTSMRVVIEAALDAVTPAASAKAITIERQLAEVEPILIDGDRMQQVCWNLLSNAVKFTPKGGHVLVRMESHDDDVELIVQDSGAGITPEFLPLIFDRFSQADSSAGRRHGGLGLGMAIVRHLIELHGGTVKAESAGKGQGATFTIIVPRRVAGEDFVSEEGLSSVSAHLSLAADPPPSLSAHHVLIVDHQRDGREFLGLLLRQLGATVSLAESNAAALAVLNQKEVAVIVSDLEPPEASGLDLIHAVRANPKSAGTPAIALTTHVRSEQADAALAAGYDLHMPKPVDIGQLAMAITALATLGRRAERPLVR